MHPLTNRGRRVYPLPYYGRRKNADRSPAGAWRTAPQGIRGNTGSDKQGGIARSTRHSNGNRGSGPDRPFDDGGRNEGNPMAGEALAIADSHRKGLSCLRPNEMDHRARLYLDGYCWKRRQPTARRRLLPICARHLHHLREHPSFQRENNRSTPIHKAGRGVGLRWTPRPNCQRSFPTQHRSLLRVESNRG